MLSREAVNTNFYSLWFDPTANRTRVHRFSSIRTIFSTIAWYRINLSGETKGASHNYDESGKCAVSIVVLGVTGCSNDKGKRTRNHRLIEHKMYSNLCLAEVESRTQRLRPRIVFSRQTLSRLGTVMVESKDRGHNFSTLWSANFP